MKRGADETGPGKKKVRFNGNAAQSGSGNGASNAFNQVPAYDDENEEDFEDLETAKKKRNAIKLGYTDSDDEDLEEKDAKNDDEGDMFAEEEEKKPKKGHVEYISKQKIYEVGAEVNEEDDLDEEEDEGGVKIEQFNMDQELEEGGFDADFNYIRKKDEHQMHDNWLEGVTKNEMKKARAAHARQEARTKAQEALNQSMFAQETEVVLWQRLLRFLKPKESVAGAMKRLGSHTTKVPSWKKKKGPPKKDDADSMDTLENAEKDAKELEQLIAVQDKLVELGHYEVIEQRYESIVRTLRQAEVLDDDWMPGDPLPEIKGVPKSSKSVESKEKATLWEYKWGKDSTELFGPYASEKMEEWRVNKMPSQQTYTISHLLTTLLLASSFLVLYTPSESSAKVYEPVNVAVQYLTDDAAEDMYAAFGELLDDRFGGSFLDWAKGCIPGFTGECRKMNERGRYGKAYPKSEDFCMSSYCVGSGLLINNIMQQCNATIQKLVPSSPPTVADVKKLMSKCICGTWGSETGSTAARSGLLATWFTCQNCYKDFYLINPVNQTEINRACDCIEPGAMENLFALSKPRLPDGSVDFTCTKYRRGGREHVPVPPPQAPKAPTQKPAATNPTDTKAPIASQGSAAASQAPAATNQAPAANQPAATTN
ncbi:hypothetical protein HDU97_001558 [Phlyctochytrium planicorne]|nr:hypothetical protein HDU97_001558 [Phlyctochytrium planicorne]